ncbi:MAG: type I restriction enzyme, S subunit [Methyloprofundus sp.]|nr:MAG: type I restriction enzyme, S subunit [Methyloprofundus sp.]
MTYPYVELKNVSEFINGFAFKPAHWEESGKPIIRIQNLTNSSKPFNRTSFEVDEKYFVSPGDILVSWSATLDVFEWQSEDALLNQHIFKVVPDYKIIDKNYFKYALKEAISSMMKFTRGSTMKHINRGDFLATKIPLPPLETQKQIAQVLAAADQLRKDCQQVEQELNALAQSVFLEMFGDPVTNLKGWKKNNLGGFIKIKHGYAFKGEYFASEGDYVLLTPGNFLENGGYRSQGIKQKFYLGDFPDEYMLDKGDLLVAMTEQAAGLLGSPLFSPSDGTFLHNQRLGLVQTVKPINKQFLFGLFNTSSIRQQIHFKAVGTKVRHTSPTKIEELNVGIPPINLQNKFSSFIEKLEQQKQHNKEKSQQLDDLFNALLQKAFKGELNLKSIERA